MDIKEIKNGIAAYRKEQEILLRLIRLTKGLTATRFDELFRGREYRKGIPLRLMAGDSFILGVGQNGFSEWAWQLDLLQHMMAVGLVDTARNDKDEIVYILPSTDACVVVGHGEYG